MTNWFNTLNDALKAEGLLDLWDCNMAPIQYGETRQFRADDGKHSRLVSIYRSDSGRYERPIHYIC